MSKFSTPIDREHEKWRRKRALETFKKKTHEEIFAPVLMVQEPLDELRKTISLSETQWIHFDHACNALNELIRFPKG